MPVHHALIPALRYQNAPAAIDFLCRAFGFKKHAVYADETDPSIIHHAQLTLNGNMIMLGTARADASAALFGWKTVAEAGGITMCLCAVIDDPDAHHAQAAACGADVIKAPCDNEGYPGRAYDVRDTERNVWNFGNYDPWAA
jgi:uncharacterized glyoxalase superfamily protein PhnB